MTSHYIKPVAPQYICSSENDRYAYETPVPPCVPQIIQSETGTYRPMAGNDDLIQRIFRSSTAYDPEACDFITDLVKVEKSQIEILLSQISVRHCVAQRIQEDLNYRASELAGKLDTISGDYRLTQARRDLEQRESDLHRQRDMEYVSLWRDTQKVLAELFRHWTAYTNLTRRARLMDLDL